MRGDGAADLVSEGGPLARRGQPLGRQRGEDATDKMVEVKFVGVVVADLGYVKSGFGHRVAVALLAGVVGAAGVAWAAALPLVEEAAQRL